MRRVRLLPVMIAVLGVLFGMKVVSLWSDATVAIAANSAEGGKDAAKAAEAKKPEKAVEKVAEKGDAAAKKPAEEAKHEGESAAPAAKPFDPELATDAELDVLQRLAKRRTELDERARALELREGILKAAEQRMDQKIEELKKIQAAVEDLVRKRDAEHEEKIQSLVKIYETMKPKDAARIFEQLDLPILLDVIERMREAKTAPIMASMDPAKAKGVTAALAERKELPGTEKRAAAR